MREGNPLEPNKKLCERMLSPYNLEVAVQNVKRNKGSSGVDGMGVGEIDRFMRDDWARIASSLPVSKFYAVTGLIEIETTYKRLHAERMMMDKCHGKQMEFVFD